MCTDKQSVAAYFDCLAADWDEVNTYSDTTVSQILDLAEIRPGVHIWTWPAEPAACFRLICSGVRPASLAWISPQG